VRVSLLLFVLASLMAPSARAAIAVSVSIPDRNAVHRDFAAGIVDEARARFALISPPLPASAAAACGTDEKCLRELATTHDASHVLLIGIAAIGTAEFVVSVRLLDAASGDALTNLSDIATPGQDPRASGRSLGRRAFAKVSGLPPPVAPSSPVASSSASPPADPPARPYDGLSTLSLTGWAVTGVSLVGAGTGAAAMLVMQQTSTEDARPLAAGIGAATSAGLVVGLGLVVFDQLIAQPAP